MLCHVRSLSCNDPVSLENAEKTRSRAFVRPSQTPWDSTLLSYPGVAPGLWPLCGGAWFRQRQDQEHSWVLQRGNNVDDALKTHLRLHPRRVGAPRRTVGTRPHPTLAASMTLHKVKSGPQGRPAARLPVHTTGQKRVRATASGGGHRDWAEAPARGRCLVVLR